MSEAVEESKESRPSLAIRNNKTSSKVKMSRKEYQKMLNEPFLLKPNVIPTFLPIYRGIHICTENFKRAFRVCYKQDSSILADIVTSELDENKHTEFKVSFHGQEIEPINKLFSADMLELLYARDVFNPAVRTEGSLTNARAMAHLR